MQPIPKPELLDPDRVNADDREQMTADEHRSRAQLLDKALHESCAYADQLWDQLDALRHYLLDSLPPDPRNHAGPRVTGASPRGPHDEQGWQEWTDAFAATTSVLCGAHGDSGFGRERADEEARFRRDAPASTDSPDSESSQAESGDHVPGPLLAQAQDRPPAGEPEAPANGWLPAAKVVAAVVVAGLALRGLRPRS